MLAQSVGFAGELRGRVYLRHGALDPVQVGEPLGGRRRALARRDIPLKQGQLAIPAIYSRTCSSAEKLRQVCEKREQDCRKRKQYDDGLFDQRRHPEGQIVIEEARPEALVTIGVSRDAEINLTDPREFSRLLEKPLLAVYLFCSVQQQIDERWM